MSETPSAVIESRSGRFSAFLTGLRHDRRLVPLTAALGGAALLASLLSEWQVTAFDATLFRQGQSGTRPFDSGIADIGGWGVGYLAGLFLLVACMALLLFGPVAGRAYARPAALGVGGTLLAVVVASYSSLSGVSRLLDQVEAAGLEGDEMQVSVGRGFWCAVVGVVLVVVAAWAARVDTGDISEMSDMGSGLAGNGAAMGGGPGGRPGVGPGSRPGAGAEVEVWGDEALDLTVTPVKSEMSGSSVSTGSSGSTEGASGPTNASSSTNDLAIWSRPGTAGGPGGSGGSGAVDGEDGWGPPPLPEEAYRRR